jgi:spectinomycin phosphotransferase
MLEKPDLDEDKIIAVLEGEYGFNIIELEFLPIGADFNTAVYHAIERDGNGYFLKLRSGHFNEIAVTLPKFLIDQGVSQIIPPFNTKEGRLWTQFRNFKIILYPFVAGCNGYEMNLSERQWEQLGTAFRRIHNTKASNALLEIIPRETYSAKWRENLKDILAAMDKHILHDQIAEQLAAFISINHRQFLSLLEHAENLARYLCTNQQDLVICHSDIHAGNVYVANDQSVYIVDWDDPILAPKERDLMYFGAGLMGNWRSPAEEETLFFRGYGQTSIDLAALTYYRCERIIQDLTIYCQQILLSAQGGEDRKQSLTYLLSNFSPKGTIELAYRSFSKQN